MQHRFTATRAAGLERLAAFAPHMGLDYARGRNTDAGAVATTSLLSPWLRRRMLLEPEAVRAAQAQDPGAADKFVQEVFWRSYFKGYLETRPSIWTGYEQARDAGLARMAADPGLRARVAAASAGQTGIDGFDHWARELAAQGWLHNHARMWFASIWIFTLELPWALGADLFMRHLLDGDPASNTLSWRWVAGLHTRGRAYAARAENIRRYTDGRFQPVGLNEDPVPLTEPEPPPPRELAAPVPPPTGEAALLLHLDDLHPESLDLGDARIRRVGGVLAHAAGASEAVRDFDAGAMRDALDRAAAHFGCPAELLEAPVAGWADGLPVLAPYAPVGPSAAMLPDGPRLLRGWDRACWPRATRGFFQMRAAIPKILTQTETAADQSS